MRTQAGDIANAIAWAVVLVLACVAIPVADLLGFVGVFILGLLAWVICTHAELDDDTPIASTAAFRARLSPERSPEHRAAALAGRRLRLSPLRFYRWCGIALTVIGAAGFAWKRRVAGWRPGLFQAANVWFRYPLRQVRRSAARTCSAKGIGATAP